MENEGIKEDLATVIGKLILTTEQSVYLIKI